jgi:preprotein translocase subunit SecF
METTTIATLLENATTVITSAFGTVWDLVCANPLAATFAGVTILGLAIGIFSSIKQAV